MAPYRVAYDAATYVPVSDLVACGVGLGCTLAGLAIAFVLRRAPAVVVRALPFFFVAASALVAFAFGLRSYGGLSSSRELGEAMATGRVKIVEGTVENVRETGGHGSVELFEVSGVSFRYGGDAPSAALHARSYEGGPIRPGLRVRITYLENTAYVPARTDIAKVEIATP